MGSNLAKTSKKSEMLFCTIMILLNLCIQSQSFKFSCSTTISHHLNQIDTKFRTIVIAGLLIPCLTLSPMNHPPVAFAAPQKEVSPNDLNRFKLGLREITYLLDNWEDKTTYCNFGEFQRELLSPENKAKLMEKASEFSLWDYDKTKTMNVMCKRDPQVVRAFLGLTPQNMLLNRADVLMKKSSTIDLVDPDMIDEYFEAVETYVQALATADGLAYQAMGELSSTETVSKSFGKEAINIANPKDDYLSQSRRAVIIVRDQLKKVVTALAL